MAHVFDTMKIPGLRTHDPAVSMAVGLLLAVLCWTGALRLLAPAPLRAGELLMAAPATRADTVRLVLVFDAGPGVDPAVQERVRRMHPGRPIELHAVAWHGATGQRSRSSPIAALVRSYGYTELPVLLTVSRQGQVARIQSLVQRAP